jgi:hypothetical protein
MRGSWWIGGPPPTSGAVGNLARINLVADADGTSYSTKDCGAAPDRAGGRGQPSLRRATISCSPRLAGVAQLVEQLIRNQQVLSSSLSAGSKFLSKFNDFQALPDRDFAFGSTLAAGESRSLADPAR